MPSPSIFTGTVRNGVVVWDNARGYQRVCVALEGKRIQGSLGPFRKIRTNPQNSYLHGVVYKLLGDHLGYTTEEMHDAMKVMFLCADRDAVVPRYKSTTKLTTVEFNEYVEHIQRFARQEFGVYIPDPNEHQQLGEYAE